MKIRNTRRNKAREHIAARQTHAEKLAISYSLLSRFAGQEPEPVRYEVKRPDLPPGVIPESAKMAMDTADSAIYEYASQTYRGMGFPGYPYLSELAQRSEYRSPTETTAKEMTRKWCKVVSHGEGDKAGKIEVIESELKRHKVRDLFRTAAEHDGFFGRGQIHVSLKGDTDETRQLPLVIRKETINPGTLEGFKSVEPIWTAPYAYNSTDPLAKDFFKPTSWFVMGKLTHASRLLTFVSREVPDMLKPAYNFGGMSMSQLMEPYVNSWLRTRDSVSDLLHSFSISGLKTNMGDALAGGEGQNIFDRAALFNKARDNRGLMLLDKDTEEFFQFNTSLAGLDKLQAQSQEHMAAPCHTPLVKLFGITPTGLNASDEGEISVYYDYINSMQEDLFSDNLHKIISIIQLDKFGEIDPAIGIEWIPLKQVDEEAQARIRKTDSETGANLIQTGSISNLEERARLAADPKSGYTSLDVEDVPTLPDADSKPEEDDVVVAAQDSQWNEDDHPRSDDGKFGDGGRSGARSNLEKVEADEPRVSSPEEIEQLLGQEHKGVRGQEAIDKLLQEKKGHVKGAFKRDDLGNIDLLWGDDSFGLQHIIKRREEQKIDPNRFVSDLSDVIENGKMSINQKTGRFEILSNGKMAVVSPELRGNKLTFLLTAFKSNKK